MYVSEAIREADELRPNTIPEHEKARWLYRLDGDFCDTVGIEEIEHYDYPEHDEMLIMPEPYDGVYPLYLCAMIDNANEETALYQNDITLANAAIADAKAWWRRHHRAQKKRVRCWP